MTWENADDIKEEIIKNWGTINIDHYILSKNSFLYCGISNDLEGFEDDIFIGWEKLNEFWFIENDFTFKDLVYMNNNIEGGTSFDSEEGSSDKDIEDNDK